MNENKTQEVKKLLSEISAIDDANQNETQSQFLKLISADTIDIGQLNEVIVSDEIFINTSFSSNTKSFNLDEIDWGRVVGHETTPLSVKPPVGENNLLFYKAKLNEENLDIEIRLLKLEQTIPPDVYNFIHESENVQRTLKALTTSEAEQLEQLKQLQGIVEVGGTSTYLALAKSQLEQFKKDFVLRKGNLVKYRYLTLYGQCALLFSAFCLVLILLLELLPIDIPIIDENLTINALFLMIGTATGAWLSFAIRKKDVAFEELRILVENGRLAVYRLVIIELIALIFFFMFITDFMNFEIGDSFSTANLKKSEGYLDTAFIIGAFFGLSESTLGASLTTRVETFIAKL